MIDTRARERRISHIRKLAQTHFGVVPPQLRHFGERRGQTLESDGSFYFFYRFNLHYCRIDSAAQIGIFKIDAPVDMVDHILVHLDSHKLER